MRRYVTKWRAGWHDTRRPSRILEFWSFRIFLIMITAFILQNVSSQFEMFFILYSPTVLTAPWTLVSAIFLHEGFAHIFYNMFALLMFGLVLEAIVGSRLFLVIFLATGIVGNVAGVFAYPLAYSLGASGAIMGIIGALAVIRPRLIVWMGAPMPLIVAAAIWAGLDLIGFLSPAQTGIGNAAHLAGLAAGILIGLILRPSFKEVHLIKRRVDHEFLSDADVYG